MKASQKIRKNDIVTTNIDIDLGYTHTNVLPKGSRLQVFKAQRDGTLRCTQLNNRNFFTVHVHANDVSKVDAPLPTVKIGDIFVSTGGYEQTNVTFYRVTKVKPASIEIEELPSHKNYTGPMCGEATPIANNGFNPKTVRLRRNNNTPTFKAIWGYAYPWDGQPEFFSEWH